MFDNRNINIDKFELLYGKSNAMDEYEAYKRRRRNRFVICMIITLLLVIIMLAYNYGADENVKSIERNGHGGGKKSILLITEVGDYGKEEQISIEVDEVKYSEAEIEKLFNDAEQILFDKILGDNPNLNKITSDLNLVSSLNDYPFNITWKTEKPLLVNSKGMLDRKRINEEFQKMNTSSIPVQLCATLKYENYSRDVYGYIVLSEPDDKTYDDIIQDLNDEIARKGEEEKESPVQELPSNIGGLPVTYRKKKDMSALGIMLIGIVCSFGIVFGQDKEIEKRLKKRNDELEKDYFQMISEYALYYRAGMNTRIIWLKICENYENEIAKGGQKHYAFEEMLVSRQEMLDGLGEVNAYEGFAKRCGVIKYRSFVSMIEQSVIVGRESLDILLEEELEKARREETNRTRMLVQEMSTKLLLPMMLMLVIVLIIVVVPAFISFY